MTVDDRVYVLARAALDAIINNWDADAEPLPERQYVAFGLVAWDCEQLTVSISRTYGVEADVAAEQLVSNQMFAMRGLEIEVSLIRCVPVADTSGDVIIIPTADDIEASARIAAIDERTIMNTLIEAQQDGDLGGCHGIAFGGWSAEGPNGGLGGGRLAVRLALF